MRPAWVLHIQAPRHAVEYCLMHTHTHLVRTCAMNTLLCFELNFLCDNDANAAHYWILHCARSLLLRSELNLLLGWVCSRNLLLLLVLPFTSCAIQFGLSIAILVSVCVCARRYRFLTIDLFHLEHTLTRPNGLCKFFLSLWSMFLFSFRFFIKSQLHQPSNFPSSLNNVFPVCDGATSKTHIHAQFT